MLCRDPDFQEFLLCDNETDAAHLLCKRCGIESRTELHGNVDARYKFDLLLHEFESIRKTMTPSKKLKPFMTYLDDADYVKLKKFAKSKRVTMARILREGIGGAYGTGQPLPQRI